MEVVNPNVKLYSIHISVSKFSIVIYNFETDVR